MKTSPCSIHIWLGDDHGRFHFIRPSCRAPHVGSPIGRQGGGADGCRLLSRNRTGRCASPASVPASSFQLCGPPVVGSLLRGGRPGGGAGGFALHALVPKSPRGQRPDSRARSAAAGGSVLSLGCRHRGRPVRRAVLEGPFGGAEAAGRRAVQRSADGAETAQAQQAFAPRDRRPRRIAGLGPRPFPRARSPRTFQG